MTDQLQRRLTWPESTKSAPITSPEEVKLNAEQSSLVADFMLKLREPLPSQLEASIPSSPDRTESATPPPSAPSSSAPSPNPAAATFKAINTHATRSRAAPKAQSTRASSRAAAPPERRRAVPRAQSTQAITQVSTQVSTDTPAPTPGRRRRRNPDGVPGPPRTKRRLGPQDPSPSENAPSAGERFVWNIGFWLFDTMKKATAGNFIGAENLAHGLLQLPKVPGGIHDEEAAYITAAGPEIGLDLRLYSTLRARAFIGCALIYEHNLRGLMLASKGETHIPCRPDAKARFATINTGTAQVQLILKGSNVAYSKHVMALLESHHLPPKDLLTRALNIRGPPGPMMKARDEIDEKFYPFRFRRALYQKLVEWHVRVVPRELRYVIEAYRVYERPYDVSPP